MKNLIMYLCGWFSDIIDLFLFDILSFKIIAFIYNIVCKLFIYLLTIPGHHGYPFIFTHTISPIWYSDSDSIFIYYSI